MSELQLPQPGEFIAGKYRVERVLGTGGMGTVLAVRHLGLDEPRAIKLMLPRGLELPQARERFFREARAAAKLRSDHAVKVHDVAVSPEGFPYIEMEMLEGADLSQLLKRMGAVPIAQAVKWIADACEPLGEAHALGIVHRDLKPGNLFLALKPGGGDSIKVLDFGIAKTLQMVETDPSLTGTNASFGSPLYMSPEQMRGARFAEPRSDLWALGVVLYELVTGRRPFQAESATALALVVTSDDPAPPTTLRPDLPPAVEAVIMRCLSKRPEGRYASAAELAVALRGALSPAGAEPRAAQPSFADMRAPLPSLPSATPSSPGGLSQALLSPAASPPMVVAPYPTGSPSQPTVATLSTTVGGRRSNGNALLIGGAIAAVMLSTTVGILLWRAGSSSTATATAAAPAAPVPPPPVPEAPAPEAPVPVAAPVDPISPPAADAAPVSGAVSAAPTTTPAPSASGPGKLLASGLPPRASGAPGSSTRPTRPKPTGFGGID